MPDKDRTRVLINYDGLTINRKIRTFVLYYTPN